MNIASGAAPKKPLGGLWARLGGLLGRLGPILSVFYRKPGRPGAILGVLGRSWVVLEASWALLGGSWTPPGPSWGPLASRKPTRVSPGAPERFDNLGPRPL